MIIGRNFAEKLYSANEYYEDEKLYSTGDDYLDDLLERAFCEGYEYYQREYSKLGQKINQATRDLTASRIRSSRNLLQNGTAAGKPAEGGGLKQAYKKISGQLLREAKVTDTVYPSATRNPIGADKGTGEAIRGFFGQLMSHKKNYGKPVGGGSGGRASDISHVWNGKYKS
jgi:hypothetical protein